MRQVGGTPILVTSLSRRNYKDGQLIEDPLREYSAAMGEIAIQDDVPLIDLYKLSRALLEPMSQQQADRYDATTHDDARAEGAAATTPDRTHLNEVGKKTFGDMVANAVSQNVPALRAYIKAASSVEK